MNSIISCEQLLRAKIRTNLNEWVKGLMYVSRPQAIAVAYKQVEAFRPSCRRVFSRKRKSSGKKKIPQKKSKKNAMRKK